ncbi:STAS domain-containing protein [Actinokineospora diospyrosa]|uniref:Anti-anti-sigma factor n=1 Tax=Actinokineospora diospyrosa TaxID=103728 RepID=A0ABT1IEQ4_9PSEU|nr:STAS domain-containing protein [Actinokineospora diospyrosa]MCP2271121.1 anti-anti-sigma factor [Actinokineospora diospyrosa]
MESNLIPFSPVDAAGTRGPRGRTTRRRRPRPKPGSPGVPYEGAFRGSSLLRLAISWQPVGCGVEMRIQVTGDLDMATASTLAEALTRAQFDLRLVPNATGIALDLRTVSFLGAAGMHVMARAHATAAAAGVGLRLIADHAAVTRPLALTGLDRTLDLNRPPLAGPASAPTSAVVPRQRGELGGGTA